MPIPKKIHYCWFGEGEIPPKDKLCIESWKKYCPDYEIIQWNEKNYDLSKNKYMLEAYRNKKWGFLTDYARLDIIYSQGGIYLDTDVEIIKSFDELLENIAFMGFEEGNYVNTGIGFGAEKYNIVVNNISNLYEDLSFYKEDGSLNLLPCPYIITDYLESIGLVRNNTLQYLLGVAIFPSEYFSPKEFSTDRIKITNNTFSIHHYNASWLTKEEKRNLVISKYINRTFGKKIGNKLNSYVSRIFKLCSLIRNKIFK